MMVLSLFAYFKNNSTTEIDFRPEMEYSEYVVSDC